MIRAVLFDFDDTLVKTKGVRYEAIKEAGKKFYNLEIKDSDIDKEWGKPFGIFMTGVFKNAASQEILTENYKSILGKYPNKPIKHTNEVIDELAEKYLLGIISSSNPALIMSGINDVHLNPENFYFLQSSEDTIVHKPNAEVFTPALERLKERDISKLEVIYVGDAFDDYYAAVNAGFHFCGIANRTIDESKFKEAIIPYILDIKELPSFIERINKVEPIKII